MKWKLPELGESKIIKKFAWFPTEVDGHSVWLECYWTREVFMRVEELAAFGSLVHKKWVTTHYYLRGSSDLQRAIDTVLIKKGWD
jgi:hypothetical protein